MGRESINHYRSMCRMPVFSHDELVCKMMAQPERLEVCLLQSTCKDASHMIQLEDTSYNMLKKKVSQEALFLARAMHMCTRVHVPSMSVPWCMVHVLYSFYDSGTSSLCQSIQAGV